MRWPIRFASLVWTAALATTPVEAQPLARTFEELQTLLRPGEFVLVSDRLGRETWGKIAEVSASTVTVVPAVRKDGGARVEITADRRVFSAANTALIRRSDLNGSRGQAIYPVSWDHVDALPSGTDVSILLESGERPRSRFVRADDDSLYVLSPAGRKEILRKSQVLRVVRHGIDDGTGDGAIIGALAGAGTGIGLMAVAYATACDTCDAPAPGPMFLAAGTFCAGIGAFTGWLIDRLHKGTDVVFPAVSPVLTGGRKGVAVTFGR